MYIYTHTHSLVCIHIPPSNVRILQVWRGKGENHWISENGTVKISLLKFKADI